jgi:hypothetical protein
MMYALLFLFLRFGAVEKSYLDARVAGFDRLASFVLGRTMVSRRILPGRKNAGGGGEENRGTRPRWISAKPVMLIPGYSIQRTEKGEELCASVWACSWPAAISAFPELPQVH